MMKCPPEEQLVEYAAGRLSTSERWQLSEHLEGCPDCREQVAELRAVDEWLDLLPEPEPEHVNEEDLAALAEGSLDAAARTRALAHVGECPECARLLGALRRELTAAPEAAVAAASVTKPEARPSLPVLWRWATAGAAAAALMIAFTIFFAPRLGGPASAPGPVMTAERAAPVAPPAVTGGAAKSVAPKPSQVAVAPETPVKKPTVPTTPRLASARSHRKGRPHSAFEGRQVAQLPPAPAYAPVPVPPPAPAVRPDMATGSADMPAMKAMDVGEGGRSRGSNVGPQPAAPAPAAPGAPAPFAPTVVGLGGGAMPAPGARAEVAPAEATAERSVSRATVQKARPFPMALHNAKQRAKQAKAEGH